MDLFALASKHRAWNASKQAVAAENIANANTPGFRSTEIVDFSTFLDQADRPFERDEFVKASEQTISLEKHVANAGEATSQFALSTVVTRNFHRFILSSAKG